MTFEHSPFQRDAFGLGRSRHRQHLLDLKENHLEAEKLSLPLFFKDSSILLLERSGSMQGFNDEAAKEPASVKAFSFSKGSIFAR